MSWSMSKKPRMWKAAVEAEAGTAEGEEGAGTIAEEEGEAPQGQCQRA